MIISAWIAKTRNEDSTFDGNLLLYPEDCKKCGKDAQKAFQSWGEEGFVKAQELSTKLPGLALSCCCKEDPSDGSRSAAVNEFPASPLLVTGKRPSSPSQQRFAGM